MLLLHFDSAIAILRKLKNYPIFVPLRISAFARDKQKPDCSHNSHKINSAIAILRKLKNYPIFAPLRISAFARNKHKSANQ
ncbi:MAG: hypothetical protein AAF652_02000 [Cyanobacteria bacterium P01_C01_bin.72]